MSGITIYEFQPLWLTLDRVGPFQDIPYEIDFTDGQDQPCNLFLLMSENGRGKTTVLECIALLMHLLGAKYAEQFGHEDLDAGEGRIQLDVLTRIHWKGLDRTIVLSLTAGNLSKETFLKVWDTEDLDRYGAQNWHRIVFRKRTQERFVRIVDRHDDLVQDLRDYLSTENQAVPQGFANSTLSLPTALYFPAYRDIPSILGLKARPITQPKSWGYRSALAFPAHSTHRWSSSSRWTTSLDNLLVWLAWLDDGSFESAVEAVNETVFGKSPDKFLVPEIRRVPPEAVVKSAGQTHRLDRLSSGEKNLIQLFLRIGAHGTNNTWILVDELDVHLHVRWQHKALDLMKTQIHRRPGTTVIVATHSVEILEAFPMDIQEEGLIKGGFIIDDNLR